ncbi:MAG: MBL fold metallo-hydrolase [Erysipelotrichaceae bacterium]|nr:MBL fold metallo-hydrolase [Erysipelotrichaceae bacterium]
MNQKKQKRSKILSILLLIITIFYGIYNTNFNESFGLENTNPTFKETSTNLFIYFLDVGQADSILIQNKEEFMLIDAGNNEDGDLLVKYFQELGITNFKYVIGTHPHEDHIGGLDNIISSFEIGTIFLPDAITTTTTFIEVLDAIEEKNMTYTVPKIDETFLLGDAEIKVIYTGTDTSDLNNTSIVLKLTFGNNKFLFTGDATSKTEAKIINKDIQADVLKIGHHGSKYSSTEKFLDKVNPKYAIISVGEKNNYNHPSNTTIEKLQQKNINIYRTDKLGTILLTSNGKEITVSNFKTNTNGG